MIYVMPLVILGVNGIEITVVSGPVAFRRSGALAHKSLCVSSISLAL